MTQDLVLHETLAAFVTEKPPERAVHVKGYGASGYFQTYRSMKPYTKLCFLQKPGQKTPVSARFSLATGNRGTPDTSRNVRGFSVKFYTEEGVFDLLCNHIPVFLVRDAIRFPEAIRSLSPSPENQLTDPRRFWDFAAGAPEATHFIVRLYSDEGTVKSLRHLKAYSVNTYVWRNEQGERRYVRYQWLPMAGVQFIDQREAKRLAGENPDFAGADLYRAIESGVPVQYELCVQLMNPEEEKSLPYDPLDDTKIWDPERYPLLPAGRLTLNTNPQNYMEQVEKLAFSPANLLAGAELSADKMLQGRASIYWDAQRYRLGSGFRSLPVNAQAEFKSEDAVTSGEGVRLSGYAQRSEIRKANDFTQAGEFFRSLNTIQKEHLSENLAQDLINASPSSRDTVLDYLKRASAELSEAVKAKIRQAAKKYS